MSIEKQRLIKSHFLVHTLKYLCLHYTCWDYAFGHHGENNITNQQIIWYIN